MINNQEIVDSLNELVKINNDRIHGYEKSIEDTKEEDLDGLFRHMVLQSQQFRSELAEHIVRIDGSAVSDTSNTDFSSKIHRAWIDIKSAVMGKDRAAVLSSVEFGETAAIDAYEDVIEEEHIPAYIKDVLQQQLQKLKEALSRIKALHQTT